MPVFVCSDTVNLLHFQCTVTTELLSSRKLREVPAFKGKDETGRELPGAAPLCRHRKAPKGAAAPPGKAGSYQPLSHPTAPSPLSQFQL